MKYERRFPGADQRNTASQTDVYLNLNALPHPLHPPTKLPTGGSWIAILIRYEDTGQRKHLSETKNRGM